MSALKEVFQKVIDGLRPLDYYAFYECVVVKQTGDTLDLRPDDPRLSREGLTDVEIRYGIPGVRAKIQPGTRCLLGFKGGNPSLAYVHDFLYSDLALIELTVVASSKVVVIAPKVYLAEDNASHPVPFGEKVEALIKSVMSLLTTMAPIGNMGVPVLFASDVTGSSAYGSGGAVAVTTVMQADADAMNSLKTSTG